MVSECHDAQEKPKDENRIQLNISSSAHWTSFDVAERNDNETHSVCVWLALGGKNTNCLCASHKIIIVSNRDAMRMRQCIRRISSEIQRKRDSHRQHHCLNSQKHMCEAAALHWLSLPCLPLVEIVKSTFHTHAEAQAHPSRKCIKHIEIQRNQMADGIQIFHSVLNLSLSLSRLPLFHSSLDFHSVS